MATCPECDGKGTIITCCDDICVGSGHCIHGDGEEDCPTCGGEGEIPDDDEFDPYVDDEEITIDFGPCCICHTPGPRVRNLLALNRPGPTPGKGWDCVQCGLPMNGAVAVLCDSCLEAYQAGLAELLEVCTVYPAEPGRTPLADLPAGVFDHRMEFHPEAASV